MAPGHHNLNFCFPVPPELRSERVRLTPFDPTTHAELFFAAVCAHPDIFTYLSWGPFTSAPDVVTSFVDVRIHPDPGTVLFAVWDISAAGEANSDSEAWGGAFAGVIGLLDTSPEDLRTEIGFVVTLPRFRRTHVTSHAIGILLHWALDADALGLRRVGWHANAHNEKSIRAAERMGFRREGVVRWDCVLPVRKQGAPGNGVHVRAGDARADCIGVDSQTLGLCWDEWEGGVREMADAAMARMV
ncbi:acyl-CoA N-acyltransferase [Mycena epipterygia]|nr:acyl-CoA N-acyltransferase [Mycena epipterygia]